MAGFHKSWKKCFLIRCREIPEGKKPLPQRFCPIENKISGGKQNMTRSSSLPPHDSPLTKVYLGQYVSSLIQETIIYLKLSYSDLALKMFIPEMVLRDAVEGKMALTRGHWIMLGQILGLPTTYELRPGERDGAPCWEVCFPPVSIKM